MANSIPTPAPTVTYPQSLPITSKRDEIIAALKSHQVIIVAGETGSGKTTQLPKMCLEAGFDRIACTQPRRIAALTVSRRIAEELQVTWGTAVGCKIRFADHTRRDTIIKVVTDGILLAETKSDPQLRAYNAIIIDEAHERSLNIDFLIGYLRRLLPRRPKLRVVITSATIDTQLFSEAFGGAPVFQVSGRLFPVDIRYQVSTDDSESPELPYVDGAIEAVEGILKESHTGDILVFMPSERDIRETRERLIGNLSNNITVLPLMGSLSNGEQEQVFKPSKLRKVIVATNIAETSLTIPNISYVVDTGLARVSRYCARTRTKQLPIERIAQSNANQRAGRAGRVQSGVCIRLYAESDFIARPEFTDPEIRRTNLAEVILRMKAHKLGSVAEFPFISPPSDRAVRSGHQILHELGAVNDLHELTPIGARLARLPADPTIGRMLFQAVREHAVADVLVIAAALSIPDPRERPLDKREVADAQHRKFKHPDSDFLTLLNLWHAFQAELADGKSTNKVRKFCRANFLSFMRMREWLDVHNELSSIIKGEWRELKQIPPSQDGANILKFDGRYRAIHRSVLSGCLSQISYRIERNTYRASAGRMFTLAPGTALSEKRSQSQATNNNNKRRAEKPASRQQWMVAGEVVDTGKLYARMVATITPTWVEEIGHHLTKKTTTSPEWSVTMGSVVATQRVTIYGLELACRRVDYAKINPVEAKELFIQHALVASDTPLDYEFIRVNFTVRDRVASLLARARRYNSHVLNENLANFYERSLPSIASTRELVEYVRGRVASEPNILQASEDDLLGELTRPEDSEHFPDSINCADTEVAVTYRYEPGSARDGITLALPLEIARNIPAPVLDGVIPGLREEQIVYLLRSLPKEYRTQLHPIKEVANAVVQDANASKEPLISGTIAALARLFEVTVPPNAINMEVLPPHLRPRIEITDGDKVLGSGRSLTAILGDIPVSAQGADLQAWQELRTKWERKPLLDWSIGDLPAAMEVLKVGGVGIYAYPGVVIEEHEVALRLLETKEDAIRETKKGIPLLLQLVMKKDWADILKQARMVSELAPLAKLYLTAQRLQEGVVAQAREALFHVEEIPAQELYPLREDFFVKALGAAKVKIPNLVPTIINTVRDVLRVRQNIIACRKPYPGMREDLNALLPEDFLFTTPYPQLPHLVRFIKAMLVRAERASLDPGKDRTKAGLVRPFLDQRSTMAQPLKRNPFYWMVEEYKVSVFAPELGTPYTVSAKRLERYLGGTTCAT